MTQPTDRVGDGVRVYRWDWTRNGRPGFIDEFAHHDDLEDPSNPNYEPGRWFPEAHAAAMVAVVEAARIAERSLSHANLNNLRDALDAYLAAKGKGS